MGGVCLTYSLSIRPSYGASIFPLSPETPDTQATSHIKFVYEVKSAAVWDGLPLNPTLLFYCLVKFLYTFDGTQQHRHHDNTDSG